MLLLVELLDIYTLMVLQLSLVAFIYIFIEASMRNRCLNLCLTNHYCLHWLCTSMRTDELLSCYRNFQYADVNTCDRIVFSRMNLRLLFSRFCNSDQILCLPFYLTLSDRDALGCPSCSFTLKRL
jgi:hypothetical protein